MKDLEPVTLATTTILPPGFTNAVASTPFADDVASTRCAPSRTYLKYCESIRALGESTTFGFEVFATSMM